MIRATRQKIVASLLIALYGAVGMFGYGLHSLVPCGDEGCCVDVDSHDCDCGFHSLPPKNFDEPSFAASEIVHNPVDCAICLLIAQMKAGQVDLPPPAIESCVTSEVSLVAGRFATHAFYLTTLSRGPPVCS